jgi:hypothetical protein
MLCEMVKLGSGRLYRVPNVDTLDRAHSAGAAHSLSYQFCADAVGGLFGFGWLSKNDLTPSRTRAASEGNRKPWEYL